MHHQVIDVRVGMNAFKNIHLLLAAMAALSAGGNKMIFIKLLQQCSNACNHLPESRDVLIGECPRFVGYLPSHDCRVIGILNTGAGVCTSQDKTYELLELPDARLAGVKLPRESHELRPCVWRHIGVGYGSVTVPAQILGKAPAPVPCVVKKEDGVHPPFAHFGKQEVEPVKHLPTVFTRGRLQRRGNPERLIVRAFRTNHDPEVCDADTLHVIQLPEQPPAVTILSLSSKYGTVPVVCSDKIIWLSGKPEDTVINCHIIIFLTASATCEGNHQQQPCKYLSFHAITYDLNQN